MPYRSIHSPKPQPVDDIKRDNASDHDVPNSNIHPARAQAISASSSQEDQARAQIKKEQAGVLPKETKNPGGLPPLGTPSTLINEPPTTRSPSKRSDLNENERSRRSNIEQYPAHKEGAGKDGQQLQSTHHVQVTVLVGSDTKVTTTVTVNPKRNESDDHQQYKPVDEQNTDQKAEEKERMKRNTPNPAIDTKNKIVNDANNHSSQTASKPQNVLKPHAQTQLQLQPQPQQQPQPQALAQPQTQPQLQQQPQPLAQAQPQLQLQPRQQPQPQAQAQAQAGPQPQPQPQSQPQPQPMIPNKNSQPIQRSQPLSQNVIFNDNTKTISELQPQPQPQPQPQSQLQPQPQPQPQRQPQPQSQLQPQPQSQHQPQRQPQNMASNNTPQKIDPKPQNVASNNTPQKIDPKPQKRRPNNTSNTVSNRPQARQKTGTGGRCTIL